MSDASGRAKGLVDACAFSNRKFADAVPIKTGTTWEEAKADEIKTRYELYSYIATLEAVRDAAQAQREYMHRPHSGARIEDLSATLDAALAKVPS